MSIVGTRPPLISETNLYELHHYELFLYGDLNSQQWEEVFERIRFIFMM